jgi:hypothetical protein
MLGISRWAGTGGSYRTVMRFFATVIPPDFSQDEKIIDKKPERVEFI